MLGIIPARLGSKGVKNKNIRILGDKPLIAYTIEEAIKSNIFEDIIVSTEDDKIANISLKYGAQVPFIRPKDLANDNSKTIDVIKHSINFMKDEGKEYNEVMILQPTSPFREAIHIIEAYKLFFKKDANFVLSVCKCSHSPLWMNKIDSGLRMDNFIKNEVKNLRRQELEPYYEINGAIYIAKINELFKENALIGKKSYAYIMTREDSIDIDTELDFKFCEFLVSKK